MVFCMMEVSKVLSLMDTRVAEYVGVHRFVVDPHKDGTGSLHKVGL